MELLLVGLNRNKTILLLDLGYNRIGDHGIELLANWLKTTPPLLGLNIAANHIGDTGARFAVTDLISFFCTFIGFKIKMRYKSLSCNYCNERVPMCHIRFILSCLF